MASKRLLSEDGDVPLLGLTQGSRHIPGFNSTVATVSFVSTGVFDKSDALEAIFRRSKGTTANPARVMSCVYCGVRPPEDMALCPHCGAPLP